MPESAAPYQPPALQLQGVAKAYERGREQVQALAPLDWEVAPGSFWAVCGRSGSGKSTLLQLLGCLERPSAGSYYVQGEKVHQLADSGLSRLRLKTFGFIFQAFYLVPRLSVLENIALPLLYAGYDFKSRRQRAWQLARQLELTDRVNHTPEQLSGGQQQRVAIGRALAMDPQILLADEPTGNLDSHTGAAILEVLQQHWQQGKTLILVTHDAQLARQAPCRLELADGQVCRREVP